MRDRGTRVQRLAFRRLHRLVRVSCKHRDSQAQNESTEPGDMHLILFHLSVWLLGICFRARRTGNGQNGDGRRGVRGSVLAGDEDVVLLDCPRSGVKERRDERDGKNGKDGNGADVELGEVEGHVC